MKSTFHKCVLNVTPVFDPTPMNKLDKTKLNTEKSNIGEIGYTHASLLVHLEMLMGSNRFLKVVKSIKALGRLPRDPGPPAEGPGGGRPQRLGPPPPPWGPGGIDCGGVGTHQDTTQSPKRLYKGPHHFTETYDVIFFQENVKKT